MADDFDDFPDHLLMQAFETAEKRIPSGSASAATATAATATASATTTTTTTTTTAATTAITPATTSKTPVKPPQKPQLQASLPQKRPLQNSRPPRSQTSTSPAVATAPPSGTNGPAARVKQPMPQRLSRPAGVSGSTPSPASASASTATAAPASASESSRGKVVQPTPQVLPKPSSGSSIIVSMRQKGNPLLSNIKKCPWEYGDIPADYVMGVTTCALFLSLKYHRLHPEYIYKRIQDLKGRYELRVVLALVDITDHHDSLRELSKTSLVNNVTLICCWSAKEAAHYIETYKLSEHSTFALIKGQKVANYAERVYNFVTAVPSLNRSEAMSLIIKCGSLRAGINADADTLSTIGGWGDVKIRRWLDTLDEPFRPKKAARMDILSVPGRTAEESARAAKRAAVLEKAVPLERVARHAEPQPHLEHVRQEEQQAPAPVPTLSSGVAEALAKLRRP